MTKEQFRMVCECIEARVFAIDRIIREKGNTEDTTFWQESKRETIECLEAFRESHKEDAE